jgi:hypothetical protein
MNRILVTGMGRSGTTVLGRMLNYAPDTNYLLEPFNRHVWMQVPDYQAYLDDNSLGVKRWMYKQFISNVLDLKGLVPWPPKPPNSRLAKLGSAFGIRKLSLTTQMAVLRQKVLNPEHFIYKDPSACFLAGHLLKEYGFKVVYTVRHPAALYIGRKELNWVFSESTFELQPDLIEALGPMWDELAPLRGGGILEQSIILWMCTYAKLSRLEQVYPDQVFRLRHEDWCENPVNSIHDLYGKLGLHWSAGVEDKVTRLTSGKSESRKAASLATLEARDSKALIFKWKNKVTQEELELIQRYCGDLLNEIYPEPEFSSL